MAPAGRRLAGADRRRGCRSRQHGRPHRTRRGRGSDRRPPGRHLCWAQAQGPRRAEVRRHQRGVAGRPRRRARAGYPGLRRGVAGRPTRPHRSGWARRGDPRRLAGVGRGIRLTRWRCRLRACDGPSERTTRSRRRPAGDTRGGRGEGPRVRLDGVGRDRASWPAARHLHLRRSDHLRRARGRHGAPGTDDGRAPRRARGTRWPPRGPHRLRVRHPGGTAGNPRHGRHGWRRGLRDGVAGPVSGPKQPSRRCRAQPGRGPDALARRRPDRGRDRGDRRGAAARA